MFIKSVFHLKFIALTIQPLSPAAKMGCSILDIAFVIVRRWKVSTPFPWMRSGSKFGT